MKQMQTVKCEGNKNPDRINEGQEKSNNRNVTTPRPLVQPAPQPSVQPAPKPLEKK
ncbi:MAG: hypothetical protein HXX16_12855 [Bacteroidales bacterium]|nr:hypothetical protein [Bacteroidales bacterium]